MIDETGDETSEPKPPQDSRMQRYDGEKQELPLHCKVASFLFGWAGFRPVDDDHDEVPVWWWGLPPGEPLDPEAPQQLVPPFDSSPSVGYLLEVLNVNLLCPPNHLEAGEVGRWVAVLPATLVVEGTNIWMDPNVRCSAIGRSPAEALCNLVVELQRSEFGRKYLLTCRNRKL